MKSKDFINQVKLDKLTLQELHKLDNLNIEKFTKFGDINLLSLIIVDLQKYLSSSIINANKKPYYNLSFYPRVNSVYLENNLNFSTRQSDKNFK